MPIKQMKCGHCDAEWDFYAFSSREIPQCEKCGETSKQVEQFPKHGAFRLKGDGWESRGGYS